MACARSIRHINSLQFLSSRNSIFRTPKFTSVVRCATPVRIMSTAAAPTKYDWLVILPDHEGALARRMEVRPKHLSDSVPNVDSGFWKMGGAMLEDVPRDGEALKIIGSTMMAHASSKEEVMEMIKKDIYYQSNVWNLEKIQIYPVKVLISN